MNGAARQAAGLFALAGVLAIVGIGVAQGRPDVLLAVALCDLATAALTLVLPWHRWPAWTVALLGIPAFTILAVSTWAFGGFAAGTGPFFVLSFAWLGLHCSRRVVLAYVPVALLAYVVPLLLTGAPSRLLASTVVLLPIAVSVGLVIGNRVRELERAREAVEREERWRAALMASLAHDVRSPLTVLKGALDLIGEDGGALERHASLFASMQRQVGRLSRLASTLLDVERIEGGALQLDRRWVDLDEALGQVLELAGGSRVQHDLPPGLKVWADPERLDQMLANLIGNALRHGAPPVVVGGRRDAGRTVIAVRDHGRGVPVERRDRLFERFGGTGAQPGTHDGPGTTSSVGLGLWSTRLLAEAHGGQVTYRPADPGSVFELTLPDPPD